MMQRKVDAIPVNKPVNTDFAKGVKYDADDDDMDDIIFNLLVSNPMLLALSGR
jgi:hypothetical protein